MTVDRSLTALLVFARQLGERAKRLGIPVHMDGARLFNATVHLDVPASRIVQDCASVSICLSKGLGAPVGSVLVGDADFIQRLTFIRLCFALTANNNCAVHLRHKKASNIYALHYSTAHVSINLCTCYTL